MSTFVNDEYLNQVLTKLSTIFVCSRYVVDTKTGETQTCISNIELKAVEDNDDIIADIIFRESDDYNHTKTFEYTIPTDTVVDALDECIGKGVSPVNTSGKLDEIVKDITNRAFKEYYGNDGVTLFDMLSKSDIVITDKDGKPIVSIQHPDKDNSTNYISFTDPNKNIKDNKLNFTLHTQNIKENPEQFSSFYDDIESAINELGDIVFNVYNKDLYPDTIFEFRCKKDIHNIFTVNCSCINQDTKLLNVMKNNYGNCKQIMVQLSNQKRNEDIDLLSLIG